MKRTISLLLSDVKWHKRVVYDVFDPVANQQIEQLQAKVKKLETGKQQEEPFEPERKE